MHYYEVWVRSQKYRGKTPLTYTSEVPLRPGQIVQVPLQREVVYGVVLRGTNAKPRVALKAVASVLDLPLLPSQVLELGKWMLAYYRSSVGAVTQTILPPMIPVKTEPRTPLIPSKDGQALPKLNDEQEFAVNQISSSGSYLLRGRTGSGKTRIYQELSKQRVLAGRSVLILSPEIGLTTQLVNSLEALGIAPVINLHSGLTNRQRFDIWKFIADSSAPLIVVGARSALFSPLKNIGLVVVDEFHETAYKQEQEPRYQATRAAAVLARSHHATLVYGSATPSLIDYHIAETGNVPILELKQLATKHNVVAKTRIVDLKHRSNFTRSPLLSDVLVSAMQTSLQRSEQTMLYLNRRGTARVSLCQNCGWQALCPHCDLPLTYHGDSHQLRCHSCNTTQPTPSSCPACSHTEILFRGAGSKAIVDEAQRLFPKARIFRFDSDNTVAEGLEKQYESIRTGAADIIIGTQTLAKGIDLPLLSTLGVVTADSSLQLPDFTANERTFQLLTQVLGRVQRGHRESTAIIQTFNPDNPLIRAAISYDWDGFYRRELEERRLFAFPPFYHLLTLRCRRATAGSAEQACLKLIAKLKTLDSEIILEGPAPSLHEKSSAGYTWQVIVKAKRRADLLTAIDALPSTVTSYDLDPVNLL